MSEWETILARARKGQCIVCGRKNRARAIKLYDTLEGLVVAVCSSRHYDSYNDGPVKGHES